MNKFRVRAELVIPALFLLWFAAAALYAALPGT